MAHTIKTLLNSVLHIQDDWKIDLLRRWPEIIGDLGSKVILEKIEDSTLVVSVENSCWLQELYLLSPVLIKAINEKLDQPRIKRLRFKQQGIKKKGKQSTTIKPKRTLKEVILSQREHSALEKITDPELNRALKSFLVRCYQEKEE